MQTFFSGASRAPVSMVPNPFSWLLRAVGVAIARLGLISESRARRTAELAWPRILTGIGRMSKSAADVAMVGAALGSAAITGVGYAGPFWGAAFSIGGGLAAGTIALVSQRFSADEIADAGQALRSSAALTVAATLPIAVLFYSYPAALIGLLTDRQAEIAFGADYLRVVAFGVPFAGLNLIGSRALIGADDAYTAMVLRGGGALANIGLNGVFIFGLGWGVVGAGLGTVLSNVVVTTAFVVGLSRGRLPAVGAFPMTVSVRGAYWVRDDCWDIVTIGLPVVGRNSVWTLARFPLLAFMSLFGQPVAAAYIIVRRVFGIMNTPGWGFGLAASSLVGQELGQGRESTAAAYGREITLYSVVMYVMFAGVVCAFAGQIVGVFVDSASDPSVPIAVTMVYVAAAAVIPQGIGATVAGALDATGDTRWPFYSRAVGMLGALPLVYLGATTPLGLYGIYLSLFSETCVPAVVNYLRFRSGKWKAISREYRPDAAD
ncbi:MATE family efflux transporter [Halobacterium sp. BOL4-2]|nr:MULTISPECIES: MATE family efflux transporter [Halobacterium]MDL0121387.1 MATE family efflux transporter [Halobacterium salinarum]MDL0127595.1 MATE family efflux transporter [Halobacterium salinarum]QRY25342.1 MATE family efflux transporter [Halobacterium sp. BOL4-2]